MAFLTRLKALDRPAFHLALIALLGLVAYSNTFNAPFQWDDKYYISQNPIIQDLGYFSNLQEANKFKLYTAVRNRYVGYFTFALNYKFNGFDVRGWHIANIAVHLLNAVLVYFLVALTFRTPFFKREIASPPARNDGEGMSKNPPSPPFAKGGMGGLLDGNLIALFAALLFVSHPIQTEAVTYIFQRLASLMAFFYLLSIVLYIKWRLSSSGHSGLSGISLKKDSRQAGVTAKRHILYFLSLLSAVLAMKTKENAFTLPVMIALYEFFFFEGPIKKRLLWLTPILLTMLIIPLTVIGSDKPMGEIIGGLASLPGGGGEVSRWDYLFTQFRVVATYIRLLFLPINQNIAYDYPIFRAFYNPQVVLPFLFLFSVFCSAIYLLLRSQSLQILRLTAFGILWFFITLSVESSIIPIPMLINEYRLYLPSVGIIIAANTAFMFFLRRLSQKPALVYCLVAGVLVVVLSGATYARNKVWRDEFIFWEDARGKSPNKSTAYSQLGSLYGAKGDIEKALSFSIKATELNPSDAISYNNIGLAYYRVGVLDLACVNLKKAVELDSNYEVAHYNLGLVYEGLGQKESALESYRAALRIRPGWELPQSEIMKLQNQ